MKYYRRSPSSVKFELLINVTNRNQLYKICKILINIQFLYIYIYLVLLWYDNYAPINMLSWHVCIIYEYLLCRSFYTYSWLHDYHIICYIHLKKKKKTHMSHRVPVAHIVSMWLNVYRSQIAAMRIRGTHHVPVTQCIRDTQRIRVEHVRIPVTQRICQYSLSVSQSVSASHRLFVLHSVCMSHSVCVTQRIRVIHSFIIYFIILTCTTYNKAQHIN